MGARMKHWIFVLAAPLALAGQPLAAAEEAETEQAEMLGLLAETFDAQPLTSEQQARLPAATALIDRIVPQGTMQEIMRSMFDGMLDPLMKLAADAKPDLVDFIGRDADDLGLTSEQVAEIAEIVDPRWRERQQRTMAWTQTMIGQLMTAMEPAMKRGMAEAYAVHFTAAELDGIAAFFATDIGATYAQKSYKLNSDPRIMAAVMGEMQTMFATFAAMLEQLETELADLPPQKDFEALDAAERQRIMALTGLDEEALHAAMIAAAGAPVEDSSF